MKDIKESYPVRVAEYAVHRGIDKEPFFAWWVSHAIKKKGMKISKLQSKVKKKTHGFGLEVPTSVEEAYRTDKKNGDTFWRAAI